MTSEAVMHPDDECRPVAWQPRPPLQLGDAVWAAADTVLGRFGCNRADCRDCAKYVFATIPADATLAIDTEWLREVWDKMGGEVDMQSGHPVFVHPEMIGCLCLYGDSYDWRFDGCIIATITTRHQFTQLATAIGIQPQPPKVKE